MRAFRVMRRWTTYPVLFLPLQRGPLHGFYHFFFGYFLPVFWHKYRNPQSSVAVVDCDPLNHWFELLPGTDIEIIPRDKALKIAYFARHFPYANGYRIKPIIGWDKANLFPKRGLAEIQSALRKHIRELSRRLDLRKPMILLLGRDFTPDFYSTNLPARYGVAKRNIPNLKQVEERLKSSWDIELVDGAKLSPLEMAAKCASASVIVGQHGAALSNLVFLDRHCDVVEIGWPTLEDQGFRDMYQKLCAELGIRWHRPILQDHQFAEIKDSELEEILTNLIPGKKLK